MAYNEGQHNPQLFLLSVQKENLLELEKSLLKLETKQHLLGSSFENR
jgi:hypothetical protein